MRFTNAWSDRGGHGRGVHPDGPLLHASPVPPVPASKTGATYRAACGAQVRNVTTQPWSAQGPRRCRPCVSAAAKALGA